MENAVYDELTLTPIDSDETYSKLRMTHTKVRPSDDLTRRADIDQNTTKGVKQTSAKGASSNTKVNTLLITMIVILLLTLTSIALSVATFSRLTSELSSVHSKLASQLDNPNEDTTLELNLRQLNQIQNNTSHTLIQLDYRVNDCLDNLNEDKSYELNLTQFIQI
jgi:hypothetical protein